MFERLIDAFGRRGRRRAADRYIAVGSRAEARGELSQACEQYRAAILAAPDYAAAHLNLGIALERTGDVRGAKSSYERARTLDSANPFAHYNLGKVNYLAGDLEQARDSLQAALHAKPEFREASVLLAQVHQARGDPAAAAALLSAVVESFPKYAGALFNYGTVLWKLGRWREAEEALRQALAAEPDYVDVLKALAELVMQQGRLTEAAACYERVLALRPAAADAHWQLGNILADQGRLDDAVWRYRQALAIAPEMLEAQHSLCMIVNAEERPQEAIACLKELVARHPHFAKAHLSLANLLRGEGRLQEAAAAVATALALDPAQPDAHFAAGNIARDRDAQAEATGHYDKACSLAPNHVRARWAAVMSQLQAVYPTQLAAQHARAQFSRKLDELDRSIPDSVAAAAVQAVGEQTAFYLAYQEEDNLEMLRRHGALCSRIMASLAPQQSPQRNAVERSEEIIRVGVVSAHFHNHSVWNALMKGWFEQLDRKRFMLEAFYVGGERDQQTASAQSLAAHFEAGRSSLHRWVQTIGERRPDVLVYPEVGMDAMTVKLASLRLSPVQIAGWGHPQTTGLPTIDYFLSAQDLEPNAADQHYSEKLVRLPHLGCWYEAPRRPSSAADGDAPDLDAGGPLLICPGTPFKYSPEHDHVLADIAAQLDDCRLVFFTYRIRELSDKLRQRMLAEFERRGVDSKKLLFIPWQSPSAFRLLMRRSSVFLDTIGFSGFNTAMQAVECRLPIVTREGRFLRGRLAAGILRRMGLDELVAPSDDEYARLALKLCTEPAYREHICQRMDARQEVLYEDRSTIRALEEFLMRAVNER